VSANCELLPLGAGPMEPEAPLPPTWRGRPICTDFWEKPVPSTAYDWSAVLDGYEGGDPIGYGSSEQAAIEDLKAQLDEHEETA